MANGKTEIIGVIIPNLYMHYYSDVLDHIISTYEKYGYKFIVFAGKDMVKNIRIIMHIKVRYDNSFEGSV